jgi:hypothetical protein
MEKINLISGIKNFSAKPRTKATHCDGESEKMEKTFLN